jgi:hypothetical protein
MSEQMSDVIHRLQTLPIADQEAIAPKIASYIDKLEALKGLIQEGIDSGESQPLTRETFQDVIKRGQERKQQRN